jgi:hypothetical protein
MTYPAKVYWKQLRLILGIAKRYIQKWDLQLQANLTDEEYACVSDVLTAIVSCLALLPQNPETDDV